MDVLFFLTDRYPYGKGEAFIENEITFLENRFDRVYIFPTALTADTSISRKLSSKFIVLPPANTDDLYSKGRPSELKRIIWSIKYMLPWCIKALFAKDFWRECEILKRKGNLRLDTIAAVMRVVAPTIRNEKHFNKLFKTFTISEEDNYYLYSYWFNNFPCSIDRITGVKRDMFRTFIMRAHRVDLYEEMHACRYIPFREKSFESLDKLILISEDGYNYITQRYPVFKGKCTVSRLGTKDYGVGPDSDRMPFVLVSCSFVIPVKRVERIVKALSLIQGKRIHWIHFGAGQDYNQLKKLADEKLGNSKYITFDLKGQFFNKDLMEYYQNNAVSLFVNVSESEGLPVSIMEAISFGIPVVATNVGGTSEAFFDKADGALLSKDFKDEDLASQIIRFHDMDNELYTRKRRDARCLWEERFDASYNYEKFVSTFFK